MAVCTHTAKLRKTDGSHKSSFELISQSQLPKYSVRDRDKKKNSYESMCVSYALKNKK